MTLLPPAHACLLSLGEPASTDPRRCGGKAARLAAALQAGHPVPEGYVLPVEALQGVDPSAPLPPELVAAIAEALARLGGPVAVRSSGLAEDLAEGSFAGQYETVLDVQGPEAACEAVRRCLESARSERVRVYRESRGLDGAPLALLLQRYLPARAAGVAFTAHPVTGERDVVVLSAVAGVGEGLVSGQADAEEWEIRGEVALRRRCLQPVLSEDEARQIARLARSQVGPTDIEWALHEGALWLLQARPMTALPEPVRWEAPLPGGWVRNFRLGEWLGAPMTPLFESWYLHEVEEGQTRYFEQMFAMQMPRPLHVRVNGWYFLGLPTPSMRWSKLGSLLWNLLTRFHEMAALTPPLAHLGFDRELRRWREQLLPAWRQVVAEAEARVDNAPVAELPGLIQGVIDASAAQSASIIGVAGYAAKAEGKLFERMKADLPGFEGSPHELVQGAAVVPSPHDVEGLDWFFPTLGERVGGRLPAGPADPGAAARRRDEAEARTLAALPPKKRAAFARAVAEARRAHAARQEQTGLFTLGHPVMRRALLRLGDALVASGQITRTEDLFFLTREELAGAVRGEPVPPVAARRVEWERQRRLSPPLIVGELTGMFKDIFGMLDTLLHHPEHDAPDALRGMPGSPGRVSGPARVVRSIDELDRLQPGEVLIAPVTTPQWTLAFGRAIAVVTDTGSVASHASIVAREYGIPAVVGTGDATARIVDGQRVTVDGGRGVVRLEEPSPDSANSPG